MPEYRYTSRSESGRKLKGRLLAQTPVDLVEQVKARKEYLIDYSEIVSDDGETISKRFLRMFKSSVPKAEVSRFLDELRIFLEAGIPVTQSLREVLKTTTNKSLNKVIQQMKFSIEEGSTLAESMESHTKIFDIMLRESIKLGETSGSLPEILRGQAIRLESEAAMASKMKGQSIYPAFLIVLVIGLMIALNTVVIPQMMEAYSSFLSGGQVPPKTAKLLAINKFLSDYGLFFPVGIIILTLVWVFGELFATLKRIKDLIKMHVPILKSIILMSSLKRICEGLQIGMTSGMQITNIFTFLEKNLTNLIVREKLCNLRSDVLSGTTLSDAAASAELDSVFSSMVTAGEATGNIPYTMEKAALYYSKKLDGLLSTMFSVCSVLVILILGIVVGYAMMSIIVPMYELPTVLT